MATEPTQNRGTPTTAADAIQAQILLDQCHNLIGERDYRGATASAQKATELVGHQPGPYIALGEAMTGMESHQQAVEAYNQAYQRAEPELRYEILVGRAYSKHCTGDHRGFVTVG